MLLGSGSLDTVCNQSFIHKLKDSFLNNMKHAALTKAKESGRTENH